MRLDKNTHFIILNMSLAEPYKNQTNLNIKALCKHYVNDDEKDFASPAKFILYIPFYLKFSMTLASFVKVIMDYLGEEQFQKFNNELNSGQKIQDLIKKHILKDVNFESKAKNHILFEIFRFEIFEFSSASGCFTNHNFIKMLNFVIYTQGQLNLIRKIQNEFKVYFEKFYLQVKDNFIYEYLGHDLKINLARINSFYNCKNLKRCNSFKIKRENSDNIYYEIESWEFSLDEYSLDNPDCNAYQNFILDKIQQCQNIFINLACNCNCNNLKTCPKLTDFNFNVSTLDIETAWQPCISEEEREIRVFATELTGIVACVIMQQLFFKNTEYSKTKRFMILVFLNGVDQDAINAEIKCLFDRGKFIKGIHFIKTFKNEKDLIEDVYCEMGWSDFHFTYNGTGFDHVFLIIRLVLLNNFREFCPNSSNLIDSPLFLKKLLSLKTYEMSQIKISNSICYSSPKTKKFIIKCKNCHVEMGVKENSLKMSCTVCHEPITITLDQLSLKIISSNSSMPLTHHLDLLFQPMLTSKVINKKLDSVSIYHFKVHIVASKWLDNHFIFMIIIDDKVSEGIFLNRFTSDINLVSFNLNTASNQIDDATNFRLKKIVCPNFYTTNLSSSAKTDDNHSSAWTKNEMSSFAKLDDKNKKLEEIWLQTINKEDKAQKCLEIWASNDDVDKTEYFYKRMEYLSIKKTSDISIQELNKWNSVEIISNSLEYCLKDVELTFELETRFKFLNNIYANISELPLFDNFSQPMSFQSQYNYFKNNSDMKFQFISPDQIKNLVLPSMHVEVPKISDRRVIKVDAINKIKEMWETNKTVYNEKDLGISGEADFNDVDYVTNLIARS